MAHPCATDPELWFGYPDDDGSDGAAKARAYERSATQARINACAGARSYSSAGVLNTRSSIGWSTAYGPASSFPAASTESANSSRQPTTCCVGLPAARSIQAAPGQCGSAGPQRRTRGHPGARGRGAPADRTGWPTTGRLMPGRQARQLPNPA